MPVSTLSTSLLHFYENTSQPTGTRSGMDVGKRGHEHSS